MPLDDRDYFRQWRREQEYRGPGISGWLVVGIVLFVLLIVIVVLYVTGHLSFP